MKRLYILIGWWIFLMTFVFSFNGVYGNTIAKSTTYSSIQYPDEDNDLYSQIPVRDLPEAVKDVIKEAYPDRTMAEAYIKVDGNYKVIVKTKEGKNPAYIIHQEVLL